MKKIIFSAILFLCSFSLAAQGEQDKDVICDVIMQSIDRFSDECGTFRVPKKILYVCTDGLPMSFQYKASDKYVYHDSNRSTIKRLAKIESKKHGVKRKSIPTVICGFRLHKDLITVSVTFMGMTYTNKPNLISFSLSYNYKYDNQSGEWVFVEEN